MNIESNKIYNTKKEKALISFEKIAEESKKLSLNKPDLSTLEKIIETKPYLSIDLLSSGYGKMEILHDLDFNFKLMKPVFMSLAVLRLYVCSSVHSSIHV